MEADSLEVPEGQNYGLLSRRPASLEAQIVRCPEIKMPISQNERSQMKNRATALRILKARVKQHFKEEEEKARAEKEPDKKKIEWGSQIRSYVLHPYNMVKDLRTETETSNTQAVLDGDIDEFIEAYLLQN
ncbi:MAG: hypothetical protein GF418_10900 [Chitinivibrionales bacterium]|nr:hypothetical protein [Chitinivibrionales bacterium]MBD3396123.1 hypothetical protein [Chitinivibrionales bacterium]